MWATTVYYVNRNNWSGVKIHYWGGTNGSEWGSRPSMTKTGYKVNGFDVYSYDIGNNTTLIFMDSSNDSNRDGGDVSFSDSSKPYYFNGWYTSFAACWQLKGSYNSWGDGTVCTSSGNNTGTATINLSTDTDFKLYCSANNSWYGSNGGTIPNNTSWTLNGSSDTKLAKTHEGDYIFNIDFSGSSPSVTTHAPYQVSYAAGTGASGDVSASAVTTYGSTCTLSSSTFTKTGYTQDGWATSNGGTKAYNLGATYTGGYTDVTLYPHWVENTYTVTYTATAGGSVTTPATSSSTEGQVTGVSIAATPSDGYHFNGWSITIGTGSFASLTSTNSNTFYPTSDATIQASFAADAEETHNVTVSYKCGETVVKTATTESGVGVTTARSVTAPSITGYTFSSWTLGDGLTNKSANTTTNPISIVTKTSGSYTLTANYTLNSHNVIFNANGGSGSMSNESFNYNQTKALTTNTLTRTGYVFKGWATSSANATAGTVTYADGANYTMGDADVTLYAVWFKKVYFVNTPNWTATNVKAHVYTGETAWKTWNDAAQVMTSTGTTVFGYTIFSYEFPETYTTIKFHNNGDNESAAQTWAAATPYFHYGDNAQYASVSAIRQAWKVYGSWNVENEAWVSNDFASYDESTATYTVALDAATQYSFKYVYAGTNAWYGQTGTGEVADGATTTLNGSNNVTFTTTVAGTYTFTIDYSSATPTAKVDFPVSYTVNFGVSPTGAASAPTNDKSVSDGGLVLSGTSVTFTHASANTGYTWSHWEKNSATTGETGSTYTTSITANTTVTAVYTEDMHTVTLVAGSNGSVHVTGGVATSGSAGIATSLGITAVADEGYVFSRWTVTSGESK